MVNWYSLFLDSEPNTIHDDLARAHFALGAYIREMTVESVRVIFFCLFCKFVHFAFLTDVYIYIYNIHMYTFTYYVE